MGTCFQKICGSKDLWLKDINGAMKYDKAKRGDLKHWVNFKLFEILVK